MATWEEMSRDSIVAARELMTAGRIRSSVSRSYYAAYAALTGALIRRGVQFGRGGNNPPHEQLPRLILANLSQPEFRRRQLAAALRRLREARVAADYMPAPEVDASQARDALRDASGICRALEVRDDT